MHALKLSLSAATLILAMNAIAAAQVMIDMKKMTCEQLLQGNSSSIEGAIWLSGYYNGISKNTVVDINMLKQNAAVVVKECASSPAKTVMETIETMLSQKK